MGTVIASGIMALAAAWSLLSGRWVIRIQRGLDWRPDPAIIRQLFRFGLPTGIQGVAMNLGGVFLLRFIGSLASSAEAQAAYSVGYTQLFSLVTWTSVGIMGATAAVAGQNLGVGRPERSVQGTGDTRGALYISLISQLALPLVLCWGLQETSLGGERQTSLPSASSFFTTAQPSAWVTPAATVALTTFPQTGTQRSTRLAPPLPTIVPRVA